MTQPTAPESGSRLDAPTPPAPAKPEKASVFEDFIDIFYAPSTVFARREHAGFWIPLLVVTVLIGIVFIVNMDVMEPIMDAEFRRSMEATMRSNPQITPEQLNQMRSMGALIAKVGVFVGTPIFIIVLGIVLWLVGKFFDARQTLSAAIMVAAFAYVPRVVEQIVARVQALLVDPSDLKGRFSLSLGLGRFFDPDTTSPILLAIIGRIDVFTIWVTILLVIGLAVTGKISRRSAAVAGLVVWIVGALPGVAGALRQ